jgi:iron complex outermembrane receptor protein
MDQTNHSTTPKPGIMRLFLLLLMGISLGAQAQTITGTVKEAGGSPLNGATVTLYRAKDTSVVKLSLTREGGTYLFSEVPAGSYRVGVSFVGYQAALSAPFEAAEGSTAVPALQLAKAAADLKGVVVTARKPVIEVKADKTILNVEGTINAVGSDALDLLRKSPGVTVDKDENLSLAGKNGVQVYIDGRPSPLAGQDLANYLKSLQSAQIESIELITNPSARYEAAGNAGIINIRLKKNKSLGLNGTVSAGYNVGRNARYNTGINFNYRNKGVNLFGNYTFNNGKNWSEMQLNRTVADSLFNSKGTMVFHNRSHNFKLGADFFLSKVSTLGVMVNGNLADPGLTNFNRTTIADQPTGTIDRLLVADNRSVMQRNNLNYNLNYTFTHPGGRSLSVNADYGTYSLDNDQFQPNTYYRPDGQTEINRVVYRMIAPTEIRISSVKADWEQNLGKGKLGFGGKTALVKTDNDFQRYDVIGTSEVLDRDRSNRFVYRENINAAYVNYNRPFKGFQVQVGLRVENTIAEGTSTGQRNNGGGYEKYDSTFRRNYTDLFPSAAITFNKNPMSQFSLTYSRRIDRPAYQDLNPFEFKLDEYTFQKGNINLRPQYTNSFGLTHTYKYRLTTTLNYSRVQNMFVQLPDTTEKSKAFLSKQNLATQDVVSLNISYPFQYKAYTLFMNVNGNFSHYRADFGAGRTVDLDAFGLNIYAQNSLRFGKGWTAELAGYFNAPTIYQGSFRAAALGGVDLGLQKTLFSNRATVKASVSDVFNTLRFRGETEFAGQRSVFSSRWETRQFKLALSWRFGNNGVKAARQRTGAAEEEAKRVQQGNGGMGIGN